jgi:predicted dinucleotide-binding enzyme
MAKVGIIGSGVVAQKLGTGFLLTGHQVTLGSREPASEKLAAWKTANGSNASTATFEETARFGEILVVATAWSGTENALGLAGPENFRGKTVIDVTNPLVFVPNAFPTFALGHTDSAAEQIQRWLPGAHVVKAFNSAGNEHFFRPSFPGGPPTMFYCGNDDGAKKVVDAILESFGWTPLDVGGLESARFVEPLCLLWVAILFRSGSPNHAFKLLKGARTPMGRALEAAETREPPART